MSAEGRQLGFGSAWAIRSGYVNRNTPPALLLADIAPGDTTTTESNVWNSWWFSFTLVSVSGVAGTGAVTSVTTASDVDYTVSGVEGLGAVATPGVALSSTITVTGVEGIGAITSPSSVLPTTIAELSGVSATGTIGTAAAEVVLDVPVSGVEGLGAVTTPTVTIISFIEVILTGVAGTGTITNGATSSSVTYLPTGVAAVGSIKTAPAWNWGEVPGAPAGTTWTVLNSFGLIYKVSRIVRTSDGAAYFCVPGVKDSAGNVYYPSGASQWGNISPSQGGNWGTINSGNTPNWGVYAA